MTRTYVTEQVEKAEIYEKALDDVSKRIAELNTYIENNEKDFGIKEEEFQVELNIAKHVLFKTLVEKIFPRLDDLGINPVAKGSLASSLMAELLPPQINFKSNVSPNDIDFIFKKVYHINDFNKIIDDIFNDNREYMNKKIKEIIEENKEIYPHLLGKIIEFKEVYKTSYSTVSKISLSINGKLKALVEWNNQEYELEDKENTNKLKIKLRNEVDYNKNTFTQFEVCNSELCDSKQYSEISIINFRTIYKNLLNATEDFEIRLKNKKIYNINTYMRELKEHPKKTINTYAKNLSARGLYNQLIKEWTYMQHKGEKDPYYQLYKEIIDKLDMCFKVSSDSIYPEKVYSWNKQLEIVEQYLKHKIKTL